MKSKEFKKHKDNIGGLLSVNNFLSTSTDKEVGLGFALAKVDRSDTKQQISNDHELLASTYNNIGEVYRIEQDYDHPI
ncbi:unnamed protein product [Rotaria sp. Silwood2]|nr:unnamed protein product [Rotaria sp. Silwood2]